MLTIAVPPIAQPSTLPPPVVPQDPLGDLLADASLAPAGIPTRLWADSLVGPLSEFLRRPGGRFRGRLVTLAWSLAGRHDRPHPSLPLVVELLHAGSLIIDDIQDGSVQRRGKAAFHRLVGIPVAINAGNWLYFRATKLLSQIDLPPATELSLHRATAAAVQTCHEGQALDLSARIGDTCGGNIRAIVQTISECKTGGLMGLAGILGATSAGADGWLTEAVRDFGVRLGVGLQMQNDLSELTGAAGPLKHPEDLIHGRVTWPWAWAADRLPEGRFEPLRQRGARLAQGTGDAARLAGDLLEALGPDPDRPVRDWLDAAFAALDDAVGPHPALESIRSEVRRLVGRYA